MVADTSTTCYDQCTAITANVVLAWLPLIADVLMLLETTGRRSDDSRVVRLDDVLRIAVVVR